MKPSISSDGGFFVPVTFFMRLRRDPISPMRNGGKNARGKSFFPLDPFLWWYESCFLYRLIGHARHRLARGDVGQKLSLPRAQLVGVG